MKSREERDKFDYLKQLEAGKRLKDTFPARIRSDLGGRRRTDSHIISQRRREKDQSATLRYLGIS